MDEAAIKNSPKVKQKMIKNRETRNKEELAETLRSYNLNSIRASPSWDNHNKGRYFTKHNDKKTPRT